MTIRRSALAFLVLLLTVAARAEQNSLNFETAYMPDGPYRGRLLDTSAKRSIRVLGADESARYDLREGEWAFANFYHEGRFWHAVVPANPVLAVYFQKEVFPAAVPAAHSQLRFQLRRDSQVRLYPQDGGGPARQPLIYDVIFSAEATTVPGDGYDIFRGMKNFFALAYRVTSLHDAYFKSIYSLRHHVEQIPLDTQSRYKQAMFYGALRESHEAGMSRMYNTIHRSCTTVAFNVIDDSGAVPLLGRIPGTALEILPLLPRTYLFARGMISAGLWMRNRTPTMVEELLSVYGNDPYFAERLERETRIAEANRAAFAALPCPGRIAE